MAQEASIVGCYAATLGKDVYSLHIVSDNENRVLAGLKFKNFEKDSSQGKYTATRFNGYLVGDYVFQSEGTTSKMQVVFKEEGDNFIRGYGPMDKKGEMFTDFNTIKFDPKQTFSPSSTGAECL
jgi:hypothetical protein